VTFTLVMQFLDIPKEYTFTKKEAVLIFWDSLSSISGNYYVKRLLSSAIAVIKILNVEHLAVLGWILQEVAHIRPCGG